MFHTTMIFESYAEGDHDPDDGMVIAVMIRQDRDKGVSPPPAMGALSNRYRPFYQVSTQLDRVAPS